MRFFSVPKHQHAVSRGRATIWGFGGLPMASPARASGLRFKGASPKIFS